MTVKDKCPRCLYCGRAETGRTITSVNNYEIDLQGLAEDFATAHVMCDACGARYWVKGRVEAIYTSAKTEDEL